MTAGLWTRTTAEMNISVVYHSESGNTRRVADLVAEGSRVSPLVQTRVMSLEEIDKNWIESSRAVIFGCPTYAGSLSWQMKKFLDTTSLKLEGKIAAVFATENHIGGGADFAELSLLAGLLVRGMLAYSAGAARGHCPAARRT